MTYDEILSQIRKEIYNTVFEKGCFYCYIRNNDISKEIFCNC